MSVQEELTTYRDQMSTEKESVKRSDIKHIYRNTKH